VESSSRAAHRPESSRPSVQFRENVFETACDRRVGILLQELAVFFLRPPVFSEVAQDLRSDQMGAGELLVVG